MSPFSFEIRTQTLNYHPILPFYRFNMLRHKAAFNGTNKTINLVGCILSQALIDDQNIRIWEDLFPRQMQYQLPVAGGAAVLEQEDALPGAEQHLAPADWDG